MRKSIVTRAALLAVVISTASALSEAQSAAQQPAAIPPAATQTATVPAGVLKFGAALEEQASPELRKWVHGYIHKQMHEPPADAQALAAAVAQKFPSASEILRAAVVFLALYQVYEQEGRVQTEISGQIHDLDVRMQGMERRLPGQPDTAYQSNRRQQRQLQYENLARQRRLKAGQLDASLKKTNACLNLMMPLSEALKNTDPALIASLK